MKKAGWIALVLVLSVIVGDTALAKTRQISKNNVYKKFTYSVYKEGNCAIIEYAKLDSYNGVAKNVKLPAMIGGADVKAPPSRYKKPKAIRKITLEGRLLGYEGQFAKLPNLREIRLKNSDKDTYTKDGVLFDDFMGGIWLQVYPRGKPAKQYRIPKKVAVIGSHAFANCKKLKSITLPERLLEINDHAFYGCSSLKKITVPKWVSYIGPGAFKKCKARVSMPSHMKKVKDESKEGFHYELFVDCKPKDALDEAIRQLPYRDMDTIEPAAKKLKLGTQDTHKLVTHFSVKDDWYTLMSDGLQYKSSDPDVVSVDDHGMVTAKKKGTAKITVKHLYRYQYHNYVMGKYTVNVTVS